MKKINLGTLNHVGLFLVYVPCSQYSKDYRGKEGKSMLGGGIKVLRRKLRQTCMQELPKRPCTVDGGDFQVPCCSAVG